MSIAATITIAHQVRMKVIPHHLNVSLSLKISLQDFMIFSTVRKALNLHLMYDFQSLDWAILVALKDSIPYYYC